MRTALEHWSIDNAALHLHAWAEPESDADPLPRAASVRFEKRPIAVRAPLDESPVPPSPGGDTAVATRPRLSLNLRVPLTDLGAPVEPNLTAVTIEWLDARGEAIAVTASLLKDDAALEHDPLLPPAPLRVRVHGSHKAPGFRDTGWRCAADIRAAVERSAPLDSFERVLDWGCGCGRVTRHLSRLVSHDRLAGCDIDREAIDWMSAAYPRHEFRVISPDPPTPYRAGEFDLVIGVSIFTHLDEKYERLWIDELARIVRPGGLVVVSVHGPSATPPHLAEALARLGRADERSSGAHFFEQYTSADYYRSTFVTEAYIRAHWAGAFRVEAYLERALARHHDLIVLRRV